MRITRTKRGEKSTRWEARGEHKKAQKQKGRSEETPAIRREALEGEREELSRKPPRRLSFFFLRLRASPMTARRSAAKFVPLR